jgi:D-tyrosyl-tRNA(Tyr) deacylase
MVLFIGVEDADSETDVQFLVDKISVLRIFNDKNNKTNLSIKDVNGSILIISQFTLCADISKGRRPSFFKAADHQKGEKLYKNFISKLSKKKITCQNGEFGSSMDIDLINDGPFTLVLNSNKS